MPDNDENIYYSLLNHKVEADNCDKQYMNGTFNAQHHEMYRELLQRVDAGDTSINETTMQDFLEQHTAFIPTPFMLNHQLHFNVFISKFPIGPWRSDFAFLTKSTVEWRVVLMELENPHRNLFKGKSDHADFTSDYAHARQQIDDWKIYIEDHRAAVVESLRRIRTPLEDNKVSFKYVLIMGRRCEIETSEARRRAIAEKNKDDFKIITYDTLLSDYERVRRSPAESLVLSIYQTNRFKTKYLPRCETIRTSLFSRLHCEDICFTDDQIQVLKASGYEMDSWLEGKLLVVNDKNTPDGFAKQSLQNKLVGVVLEKWL